MVDITIVHGVYKPSYSWGGHHPISFDLPIPDMEPLIDWMHTGWNVWNMKWATSTKMIPSHSPGGLQIRLYLVLDSFYPIMSINYISVYDIYVFMYLPIMRSSLTLTSAPQTGWSQTSLKSVILLLCPFNICPSISPFYLLIYWYWTIRRSIIYPILSVYFPKNIPFIPIVSH